MFYVHVFVIVLFSAGLFHFIVVRFSGLIIQQEFTKKNKDLLKKFGMFRKYEDSERFLSEHPALACEETANYLVIWCIDLAVEEVRNYTPGTYTCVTRRHPHGFSEMKGKCFDLIKVLEPRGC